ncbi:hypothetical protein FRX31_015425, partial [Thalictrum thalictroides]
MDQPPCLVLVHLIKGYIESVIHDAEDKQLSGMEWQSLLQDLEKVAYQADDLIDDIAIKVLKLEGGLFPISKYQ